MTLAKIIEIIDARRAYLTQLRNGLDAQRDLDRAIALDAEIAAAELALEPVVGSASPYFLLRLTGFLREAAGRLAPRA